MAARHHAAFALFTETDLPLATIAAELGLSDHAAVAHGIKAHAARVGVHVERVSDLRAPRREPVIDRAAFAYRLAGWMKTRGLSRADAAKACGVSVSTIRKILTGQTIDDQSLVAVLSVTGVLLASIRMPSFQERMDVSHEPHVKRGETSAEARP
ncbi:helix-turn-helix domain-containing protein [Breoghania sp. L-A4]|uniref:helix-turn-helix domain-containing protein n=1 Tax=Breoghania sp. L-A4 TaxID=2304600 RepID=UPI0013C2F5D9|nr:helix-turn-helix domain-containing protein [Breoghania sp. L-A4]